MDMDHGAAARARKRKQREDAVVDGVVDEHKCKAPSQGRKNGRKNYPHSLLLDHIRQSVLRFTFFSKGHLASSVLLDPKFVDQMFLMLIDCSSSRDEGLEAEYNAKKAIFLSPDSELMKTNNRQTMIRSIHISFRE